jgi:hypothetical protein
MDSNRFDTAARLLGAAADRRAAMRTLAGSAMAALSLAAPWHAEARHKRKRRKKRKQREKQREQCAKPTILCGAICIDPRRDPENCGACDTVCSPAQVCRGGACVCPGEDELYCPDSDTCVPECCGDADCTAPEVCGQGGLCACPAGTFRCGGQDNGVCCDNGEACITPGTCAATCPAGSDRCSPVGATVCGLLEGAECTCLTSVDGAVGCGAPEQTSVACEHDTDCVDTPGGSGFCVGITNCGGGFGVKVCIPPCA